MRPMIMELDTLDHRKLFNEFRNQTRFF